MSDKKQPEGFYKENTVEITLPSGKKTRVFKKEADAIKKKLAAKK